MQMKLVPSDTAVLEHIVEQCFCHLQEPNGWKGLKDLYKHFTQSMISVLRSRAREDFLEGTEGNFSWMSIRSISETYFINESKRFRTSNTNPQFSSRRIDKTARIHELVVSNA